MFEHFTIEDKSQDEDNRISIMASVGCGGAVLSVIIGLGFLSKSYIKDKIYNFNYRKNISQEIRDISHPCDAYKDGFEEIIKHCHGVDRPLITAQYGMAMIENKKAIENIIDFNSGMYFCIKESSALDIEFKVNFDWDRERLLYYIKSIKVVDNYLQLSFISTNYKVSYPESYLNRKVRGDLIKIYSSPLLQREVAIYIPLEDISKTVGNISGLKSVLTAKGFSPDKHIDIDEKNRAYDNQYNNRFFNASCLKR